MKISSFLSYSSYVIKHKWYVFLECCKQGIPIRGLLHDWHKFLPDEFIPYMNYFGPKGIQRGRNKTGYYKPNDTGDIAFDRAFFLHQKRGSHHWQYWVMPLSKEENTEGMRIFEMPPKARLEMLCDFYGASRAQKSTGTVRDWYLQNGSKLVLHPNTRQWLEDKLNINTGEENVRPIRVQKP